LSYNFKKVCILKVEEPKLNYAFTFKLINHNPTGMYFMTNKNLDRLFLELSEADMANTSGGAVSATFLNRWAARSQNGNLPNFNRISQRLVNEFHRGGLTSASAITWLLGASANDKAAWEFITSAISPSFGSGPIAGATPAAVAGVRNYLTVFAGPPVIPL